MTMTGTIVRLVAQRGFGFIREPDGKALFFHASGVVGPAPFDDLREGPAVAYDETRAPPRPPPGPRRA
jgi:cold shock CspA family protein